MVINQYIKDKYDRNGFDRDGINQYTKDKYDINGFNRDGFHKDTRSIYDYNGFDINGKHKDTKSKYDSNGFDRYSINQYTKDKYDINGKHKDKGKIKTDQAKSFEDQKGKGYVNLPIALSKTYTNNNSKELINNIKQLINYLYDKKQITKQVYNNLIKAITYK